MANRKDAYRLVQNRHIYIILLPVVSFHVKSGSNSNTNDTHKPEGGEEWIRTIIKKKSEMKEEAGLKLI